MRHDLVSPTLVALEKTIRTYGPINKVLDLTCGYGLLGALLRNYLEKSMDPDKWRLQIVGAESDETKRSPLWSFYDSVMVLSPDRFLKGHNKRYDIVFISDIGIFEQDKKTTEILETAYDLVDKALIVVGEDKQWIIDVAFDKLFRRFRYLPLERGGWIAVAYNLYLPVGIKEIDVSGATG